MPFRGGDSSGRKHEVRRTKEIRLMVSAGFSVRGSLGVTRPYLQHVGAERGQGTTVRNSTKTEKGLVLVLGTVLSQRRLSTMRGVEL